MMGAPAVILRFAQDDSWRGDPIQSIERRFHQSHPYAAIALHVSASTNECAGSRQCQERQHASQTGESIREPQLHPHWLQAVLEAASDRYVPTCLVTTSAIRSHGNYCLRIRPV